MGYKECIEGLEKITSENFEQRHLENFLDYCTKNYDQDRIKIFGGSFGIYLDKEGKKIYFYEKKGEKHSFDEITKISDAILTSLSTIIVEKYYQHDGEEHVAKREGSKRLKKEAEIEFQYILNFGTLDPKEAIKTKNDSISDHKSTEKPDQAIEEIINYVKKCLKYNDDKNIEIGDEFFILKEWSEHEGNYIYSIKHGDYLITASKDKAVLFFQNIPVKIQQENLRSLLDSCYKISINQIFNDKITKIVDGIIRLNDNENFIHEDDQKRKLNISTGEDDNMTIIFDEYRIEAKRRGFDFSYSHKGIEQEIDDLDEFCDILGGIEKLVSNVIKNSSEKDVSKIESSDAPDNNNPPKRTEGRRSLPPTPTKKPAGRRTLPATPLTKNPVDNQR